jgi:hypothetical protein
MRVEQCWDGRKRGKRMKKKGEEEGMGELYSQAQLMSYDVDMRRSCKARFPCRAVRAQDQEPCNRLQKISG